MRNQLTTIAMMMFGMILLQGCCINGSGDVEKETREVGAFNRVSIDINGTLYVSKGDTYKVTVRTDDNLMDRIKTKRRNDTLYIDLEPSTCIDPTTLRITVQTPEIEKIAVDGSADVVFKGAFEGDSLVVKVDGSGKVTSEQPLTYETMDVVIEGSGDIDLDVDTASLRTVLDGSGDFHYTGFSGEHSIDIQGSGDVKAYGLETDITDVDIDGSGTCRVTAAEELNVDISGSGKVFYHGDPEITQHISGSGTLEKTD